MDRIAIDLARLQFFGTGIASDIPAGGMAFISSGTGSNVPDLQFLFIAAPMTVAPYLNPLVKPYADGFACRAALPRPESRGHIELASGDPTAAPRIVANFLSTDRDRQVLRTGLRLARDVGRQEAMKDFIAAEVSPGPDDWSDAGRDAHIATTGITVHHPLGTCRMGSDSDDMTVVDEALRVRGIEKLRVIMPDMIGGNINAAVIMIAEKASDLLRGKPTLTPVTGI